MNVFTIFSSTLEFVLEFVRHVWWADRLISLFRQLSICPEGICDCGSVVFRGFDFVFEPDTNITITMNVMLSFFVHSMSLRAKWNYIVLMCYMLRRDNISKRKTLGCCSKLAVSANRALRINRWSVCSTLTCFHLCVLFLFYFFIALI